MNNAGGRTALLTAALIVAGIRMWEQLRGKATTPFSEWAIGWGATFFILSILSEAAPAAAGALALIIVAAEFVTKGASLTGDISSAVTNTESSTPFVANPFAATASAQDISTPANSAGKVKVTPPAGPIGPIGQ